MRADSDMHEVLQRLAWAGGNYLLFDETYHGRMEMRVVKRAIKSGYVVCVPLDRSSDAMKLCITPIGRRALATAIQGRSDACRRRALLILRWRNSLRSTHVPFRRVLLRLIDQALKRVRIVLRAGHEFDPVP